MPGFAARGVFVAALALAFPAAPAFASIPEPHAPGEVIVQFERGTSGAERGDARESADTEALEGLGSRGLQLVKATDGDSVAATIRALEADPAVDFAEPNVIDQPSALPNDPSLGQLWGLENTGQTVNGTAGTADADIDASGAWDIETGDPETVVAVMDTGIDPTHPDLQANLWQNPGETGGNGVDDDGNGFVDDVIGYDFVGGEDGNPFDAVGHGTHVSGTVAGTGNNGQGVTGVSQRAQIMSLRACGVSGCATSDQIQAINYAGDNGARVLNASLGGFASVESQARHTAIFSHPNVLHVFAAGNDGESSDDTPAECGGASPCRVYPCAHAPASGETDNVVCVAATTQTDALAGFSNFGPVNVDLAAPGTNILSDNAERLLFNDGLNTPAEFTDNWNVNVGDTNWTQSMEAPFANPNFGITDSPGGNYATNTNYGTIRDPIAVPAVLERGCFLQVRHTIALAAGDSYGVALLHSAGQSLQYSFDSADNSAAFQTDTLEFPSLSFPGNLNAAGNLNVRLRLLSSAADVADGVHASGVVLECAETPGPHDFDFKQGTSMASPHVAGAAALLVSRNPTASTTEVRDVLLGTVDAKPAVAGNTTTGGRLNVGTAVARMPADTSITSGPGEGEEIGAPNASFGVSSNDPAATFQCSVDGANFAACGTGGTANIGPLAPGGHSLAVRSIDPRGNADPSPATRSFAVESRAPVTAIDRGPKRRTTKRKATFEFGSDEPGSTFECKFDFKPFGPCNSPRKLKRLKTGKHRFQVRATDAAGNVDATPAQKRWTVKKKRKRRR